MKKLIPALSALLVLSACGSSSSNNSGSVAATITPDQPASSSAPAESPSEGSQVNPRDHMEEYECMEVAFLGLADEKVSVSDVIENAKTNFSGFSWLSAVSDKDIVYGERGEHSDNVYVILPAETTDLRIGKYNWYAGEITDVYYDQKNSGPVIFVESAEKVSPTAKIEFVRHYSGSDSNDGIYTGFSVAHNRLRTAYHMGTVDTTPYEKFSSAEVPFYSQYLYDTLTSFEEVQAELDKGGHLSVMDELIYDSYAYALYDLEREDGSHAGYAITPDQAAPTRVMSSADYTSWTPLGRG